MIQVAHIVKDGQGTVLDLPDRNRLETLSPSTEDAYCTMRGTMLPGGVAPLHSHTDAESSYVLSGEAEALVQNASGLEWQRVKAGGFVHFPAGAKHAWRNRSSEPMSALVTCTATLGRALREMAKITSEDGTRFPSPAAARRLLKISKRFGLWLGSPEENASVGIVLS